MLFFLAFSSFRKDNDSVLIIKRNIVPYQSINYLFLRLHFCFYDFTLLEAKEVVLKIFNTILLKKTRKKVIFQSKQKAKAVKVTEKSQNFRDNLSIPNSSYRCQSCKGVLITSVNFACKPHINWRPVLYNASSQILRFCNSPEKKVKKMSIDL